MFMVAGVDEAGRGALAGPVVAGAVVLDTDNCLLTRTELEDFLRTLDDSKKCTASQREKLFIIITTYFDYGVGIVSADEIDQIGIKKSTEKAMNQAVGKLEYPPEKLLIDGCDRFVFDIPAEDIIKGDEKIPAIAAASIVAKVLRDQIMREYDKKFPTFGFAAHKGYGAKSHLDLIEQGIYTDIHRKTYDPLKTYLHQGRLF